MECRKFEITINSANNLEYVRRLFKMKVYCRVSIGADGPSNEKWTPPDKHGEINPAWNYMMSYTVGEPMLQNHNTMLVVKLYCKRKLGDRYIGEVHTPMKELFDHAQCTGGTAVVNYPVQKGCAYSQGALRFLYKFGEKVVIDKVLLTESIVASGIRMESLVR